MMHPVVGSMAGMTVSGCRTVTMCSGETVHMSCDRPGSTYVRTGKTRSMSSVGGEGGRTRAEEPAMVAVVTTYVEDPSTVIPGKRTVEIVDTEIPVILDGIEHIAKVGIAAVPPNA